MPVVKVVSVSKVSSESQSHKADHVLKTTSQSWRCSSKEASLGRAVITLRLETPSVIQYLDILNAGSAFVQVDGIEEDLGSSLVPLLPMKTLMSEPDSKANNSTHGTHCYMYKRSDFAEDSLGVPFLYLQITVTQPFKLGTPFGLTTVTVRSTDALCARRLSALYDTPPLLSNPEKKGLSFSFMSNGSPSSNKKLLGLNDAAADEGFEMKKRGPMARLLTKSSPTTTSTKNSYFATINETHDFTYKTPRAGSKAKTSSETTPKTKSSSGAMTPKSKTPVGSGKKKREADIVPAPRDEGSDEEPKTPKSAKRYNKPELQFSSNKENVNRGNNQLVSESGSKSKVVEVQMHTPTRKKRKAPLSFGKSPSISIPIPTISPKPVPKAKSRKVSDEDSLPDLNIIDGFNGDDSVEEVGLGTTDNIASPSAWTECSFKMPNASDSFPTVRWSGSTKKTQKKNLAASSKRRLDLQADQPKIDSTKFNKKEKSAPRITHTSPICIDNDRSSSKFYKPRPPKKKSSSSAPIDIDDDVLVCETIEVSRGAMSECPVCGSFIESDNIQRHVNSCLDFIAS